MSGRADNKEKIKSQSFAKKAFDLQKKRASFIYKKTMSKVAEILKTSYMNSVVSLWNEFKIKIASGVATLAAVALICAVSNLLNWSFGYEVIVDGENIGLVTDKSIVYTAIDDVKADLSEYFGKDYVYEKEPVFVRRIVSEKDLATGKDLEKQLLSNIDTMVEACTVAVDGEVLFGVSDESAAEWVLSKYKQKYTNENITDDMIVDFCEEVETDTAFVHIALLKTPEAALEILSGNTSELATHTVKNDDTLWDIAKQYGTTVEHLLAINDSVTDNIKEGMKIKVEKAVPKLSVRSVQTVSLTEPVPYEVEQIKDDSLYEGRTVVSREGKTGSARVLARITKVNGIETEKDVLESETISEPVAKIEKIGTKKRPPTTGSGKFINPSYGTLSSRYGRRWGRNHNGIDVAGSYNSNIKAADGGLVTYSGWMSGYGNYIVINHENGYQTAYGHCASLLVDVGDRVAKGDIIAKMGSTGRSTGTHLHFEVRKNGQYVDPLKYISY